ncbi:cysteinyl-tRNA synthetase [Klebsiella pneumoniae subsp. rhinoscleromatis]|nr:cysteinyl-tRNA synthetase [Klebsiella pneumoniae subsp. rhinoscleromatis]
MTSLKTSIKTITYLSDIGCLEIQGASLAGTRIEVNEYKRDPLDFVLWKRGKTRRARLAITLG